MELLRLFVLAVKVVVVVGLVGEGVLRPLGVLLALRLPLRLVLRVALRSLAGVVLGGGHDYSGVGLCNRCVGCKMML